MTNRYAHLAPVILRLALGAIFVVHGVPKLMGPADFAGFFGSIGIPAPMFMVIVVGLVEVLGGLAVLVGKFTRIAAALLAATMLVAILTAKLPMGFVNGWEFDLVLLAGALSLVLSGPVAPRGPESQQA